MKVTKNNCEWCNFECDGSYVDRGMIFCNPICAVKQAEDKDKPRSGFICPECEKDIEDCGDGHGGVRCNKCHNLLSDEDISTSLMEFGHVTNYKCPLCGNKYMQTL